MAQKRLLVGTATTALKAFPLDVSWWKKTARQDASENKQTNTTTKKSFAILLFLGSHHEKSLLVTPMQDSSICYLTISSEKHSVT